MLGLAQEVTYATILFLIQGFRENHVLKLLTVLIPDSSIQALSSELQQKSSSGRLQAVKCDVRQDGEVAAVFEAARASFGGVDVCVNNAGLSHDAPLLSGSTAEWKDMLEVS